MEGNKAKTIEVLSLAVGLVTILILILNYVEQRRLWSIQAELHKEQLKKLKDEQG